MASNESGIELDVSQVNKLVNKILAEKKGLPLMQDIGRVMVNQTRQNFRRQASPEGVPWKPIQRDGQILRDTGRLRNSITYQVEGQNKVTIGTNVEYAQAHQFGIKALQNIKQHARLITQAFGKKLKYPVYQTVGAHTRFMQIAPRPFLGFGPKAIKAIDRTVEKWSDELLG